MALTQLKLFYFRPIYVDQARLLAFPRSLARSQWCDQRPVELIQAAFVCGLACLLALNLAISPRGRLIIRAPRFARSLSLSYSGVVSPRARRTVGYLLRRLVGQRVWLTNVDVETRGLACLARSVLQFNCRRRRDGRRVRMNVRSRNVVAVALVPRRGLDEVRPRCCGRDGRRRRRHLELGLAVLDHARFCRRRRAKNHGAGLAALGLACCRRRAGVPGLSSPPDRYGA